MRKISPWDVRNACRYFGFVFLVLLAACIFAAAQNTALQVNPANSKVQFTLGDVLHTVHGTFQVKRGSLQLDPASGKMSGDIVVDAKSGESGNSTRDRKMHREILESDQYPEISFRPDRIEGAVALQGKSSVKVHGMFNIHGVDREIDAVEGNEAAEAVPVKAGNWSARARYRARGGPGGRPPERIAVPGAVGQRPTSKRSRLVGEEGFEPSRPFGHTDLNRARLPFRHPPRATSRLARPRALLRPGYDRVMIREGRWHSGGSAAFRTPA